MHVHHDTEVTFNADRAVNVLCVRDILVSTAPKPKQTGQLFSKANSAASSNNASS
jgi:hypothetical protein